MPTEPDPTPSELASDTVEIAARALAAGDVGRLNALSLSRLLPPHLSGPWTLLAVDLLPGRYASLFGLRAETAP